MAEKHMKRRECDHQPLEKSTLKPPGYAVIHLSKWPIFFLKIAVTSKTDEAIEQGHSDIGGDDPEKGSHPEK